jgi:hypothetical protein
MMANRNFPENLGVICPLAQNRDLNTRVPNVGNRSDLSTRTIYVFIMLTEVGLHWRSEESLVDMDNNNTYYIMQLTHKH